MPVGVYPHHPNQLFQKGHCISREVRNKISKTLYGRFRNSENPNWKGGKRKDEKGYIRLAIDSTTNTYVYEHRLIMEKKIGRYLHHWEVVHHINGIKDDNRIENLILFPTKSAHRRFHCYGWKEKK